MPDLDGRELIIGDRHRKTSIAVDTILKSEKEISITVIRFIVFTRYRSESIICSHVGEHVAGERCDAVHCCCCGKRIRFGSYALLCAFWGATIEVFFRDSGRHALVVI